MTSRRESLEQLRALPFRDAYRVATRGAPFAWNSVTTGLGAIATLWLVHGWVLLYFDSLPSLFGVVVLPVAFAVVTWAWVYSRALVMLLGVALAFVGAAGPFWIMNAT